MSLLQEVIHRPQRLLLRQLLFQVHLWTGIAIGLYILVISLSGAAIVFEEEMEHAIYSNLTHLPNAAKPPTDLETVIKNVSLAYPRYRLNSIYLPADDTNSISFDLRHGPQRIIAYADPVSSQVMGHRERNGTLLGWLHDLHVNLLTGKTGRLVNGFGGILLGVLCITGTVIWWPGVKNWRRALSVNFSRKWKRVNWDLHSATGFWLLAPIGMWAITGAYFTWGDQFKKAIHLVSPLSQGLAEPKSNLTAKGVQPKPAINDLIALAQRESPGTRLSRISLPTNDEGTIRVMMARGELRDRRATDNYYFDQYSGVLLQKWERGNFRSAGDLVLYWIAPLHFGDFGGVWVKALWVLIGLSPALLFVTGFLMWWNRVLSKKWASPQRSAPNRPPSPNPLNCRSNPGALHDTSAR